MTEFIANGETFDTDDLVGANGRGYKEPTQDGSGNEYPLFIAMMSALVQDAANNMVTTSTSSVAIGTGSKQFVLATDLPLAVGHFGKFTDSSNSANFMFGTVTAYVSATKTVTVSVSTDTGHTGGSGTIASWNVAFGAGPAGPTGAAGSSPTYASIAETNTGTETAKAVTPDGLAGSDFGLFPLAFISSDVKQLVAGDGYLELSVPPVCNGMDIVAWFGYFTGAAPTGSGITAQVHNLTLAADVFSTAVTIDATEKNTSTAATPAVINTSNDALLTGDRLRLDIDGVGSTTPGTGFCLILFARKP